MYTSDFGGKNKEKKAGSHFTQSGHAVHKFHSLFEHNFSFQHETEQRPKYFLVCKFLSIYFMDGTVTKYSQELYKFVINFSSPFTKVAFIHD